MATKFKSMLREGKPIGLANTAPAMDSITLTERDLRDMVLTAGYKGSKPYIAKGHDGVYDGGREPSYGYLDPKSLTFREGILYATPDYVNPELIKEIEEGKYSKLSIEFGWVNYNDVPVYDKDGNELDLISSLIRWLYMEEDLYNLKGDSINPRDVFKYHLHGVAVLGRVTPAYPQHDLAEKRTANNFKNLFRVRTVNKISNQYNKEDITMGKVENNQPELDIEVDTEQTEKTPKTETPKVKVKEVKKEDEKKSSKKEINENLRDAYDTQLDKLKREIEELKQELELSKTQKQTVLEEKSDVNMELKNIKQELNKEKVYNLWLTYRNDGRLRREDMVGADYDVDKKMATVRQINDSIERKIAEREVSREAVCSGKFFEDFNIATKEVQNMMIRNIERKPVLMENGQKSYGKSQSEPQPDYTPKGGQENYSTLLYRKSRELARKKNIDINSENFDIEYWRREAIRAIEKEKKLNGGFYA
jgi:hypothetical protein